MSLTETPSRVRVAVTTELALPLKSNRAVATPTDDTTTLRGLLET